jgi:uncharacterized protein YbbK (DUF523 family)
MAKIIVSACLLGLPCTYRGDSNHCEKICRLAGQHTLIAVCPEQMGGLPTPRPPSEIVGDRVITRYGQDVTAEYRRGAEAALTLAQLNRADCAILKARSPSCGKGRIYDGTFTGQKCAGNGIAAGLFLDSGIPVYTEEELDRMVL